MESKTKEFNFESDMRNIVRELNLFEESNINKLSQMGFFEAPASAHHHLNYKGGLFEHSYNVAKALNEMTEKGITSKWERPESPWIIGLLHDLCKCDDYYEVSDNKFEYNNEKLLYGHGEKSVMLASTLLKLTEEEVLCIRYHMGAYNKDDWAGFDHAIKKYPNVLFTHMADMYASKVME